MCSASGLRTQNALRHKGRRDGASGALTSRENISLARNVGAPSLYAQVCSRNGAGRASGGLLSEEPHSQLHCSPNSPPLPPPKSEKPQLTHVQTPHPPSVHAPPPRGPRARTHVGSSVHVPSDFWACSVNLVLVLGSRPDVTWGKLPALEPLFIISGSSRWPTDLKTALVKSNVCLSY